MGQRQEKQGRGWMGWPWVRPPLAWSLLLWALSLWGLLLWGLSAGCARPQAGGGPPAGDTAPPAGDTAPPAGDTAQAEPPSVPDARPYDAPAAQVTLAAEVEVAEGVEARWGVRGGVVEVGRGCWGGVAVGVGWLWGLGARWGGRLRPSGVKVFDPAACVAERGPYHGCLRDGEVALTFDDGPHPLYTVQILDILDLYRVKATFFVVGKQARKHPHLVREVLRRGHTVATHTDNHAYLSALEAEAAMAEVKGGYEAAQVAARGEGGEAVGGVCRRCFGSLGGGRARRRRCIGRWRGWG